ncbi:MAG: glycoside hydrolase family 13 protein [Clostridiales bacterium]|nr:glycoside hydrolase family 13 protein [Clostridiales bacterium]
MNNAAIFHRPSSEYAFALDDTHYVFRLRAQAGDLTSCAMWYADRATMGPLCYQRVPMEKRYTDTLVDWFELRLTTEFNRIAYYFELCDGTKTVYYIGGMFQDTSQAERSDGFQFAYNHRTDRLTVPDWAADAVVYNIFPDSFATSASFLMKRPQSVALSGETCHSLLGGTLRGICENLDAIETLGCNCLYLNPIFAAGCYHKYDTLDYFRVDPCFGTGDDLKQLVQEAHRRGMRVILDGVFNHVSSRHPFFQDVLAKGRQSEYYHWFYDLPKHPCLPAEGEMPGYACFSYVAHMPKTDLSYPEARDYFCNVGRYWIEVFDIDGWRLDVANEINDGFLRAFRSAVKAAKPDALIIGEVWEDGSHFLQGDMLDACMNYDFRRFALQFFARRAIDAGGLAVGLHWLLTRYKEPAMFAQLNLLDSHDVSRFLTECGGDEARMRQAVVFQMTFPGMPSVFYGDELGLTGASEPEYRQAMPWGADHPLRALYQELIALRRAHRALRRGRFLLEKAQGEVLRYALEDESERICVLFNRAGAPVDVPADIEILFQHGVLSGQLTAGGCLISLAPAKGGVLYGSHHL